MNDTLAPPVPPVPQDSIMDHPAAVGGLVAGTAALVGLLLYGAFAAGFFGGNTGDEPPIRVKGGSVDFYLVTKKDKWNDIDNKIHKKFNMGGERAKDRLDVVIAVTPAGAGSCTAQTGTGDLVTLEYLKSDLKTVVKLTIGTDSTRPKTKHSAVESTEAFAPLSTDGRTLTYAETGGYIRAILLDGNKMCTFTGPNQLDTMVIMDY